MRRTPLTSTVRPLIMLAACVLTVLATAVAPTTSAYETADPPGQGSGGCTRVDGEWICHVEEDVEPEGPTPGQTTPGKGSKPVCKNDGRTVPCTDKDGGSWNGRCYASVVDPPPAKTDRIWDGHDDGVIMTCLMRSGDCDQSAGVHLPIADCTRQWWAPAPEGSIDVEQIAREAFARARPTEIPIGIVPENKPGSIGIIGMPVWMWVHNPSTHTTGPLTATAPAGTATVTSTGRVTSIDWNMGDGTTITCHNNGTPYHDSHGNTDSPDCGHRYEKQGNPYTITATSHWEVEWHGAGQSGTFTLERTNETQITVGEAQVITQ